MLFLSIIGTAILPDTLLHIGSGNPGFPVGHIGPSGYARMRLYLLIPMGYLQTGTLCTDACTEINTPTGFFGWLFDDPQPEWVSACWSVKESIVIMYDVNSDGNTNILDVTFLIKYLYKNGPPPVLFNGGDVNCDGKVNILDVAFLLKYIY
nr:dockerin type I repeat-containing protein [candidate division Zixibacteria bacterium]